MSQVCKITEPLCNITLQQEKKLGTRGGAG